MCLCDVSDGDVVGQEGLCLQFALPFSIVLPFVVSCCAQVEAGESDKEVEPVAEQGQAEEGAEKGADKDDGDNDAGNKIEEKDVFGSVPPPP